jgi:hypothetical protein
MLDATQAQERAMTKILLISDVHIEFGELSVPKTQADVAVLAGDIHVGVAAAAWSDSLAKRLGIPVVHVAGNHEHYGSMRQPGRHLAGTSAELRGAAAATVGRVTFLERETAVVAGVRFVGCTLWTNYELFDKARYRATLDELAAEFDRHLSELQGPDTHDRVEAALASRGRVIGHPKAGASF